MAVSLDGATDKSKSPHDLAAPHTVALTVSNLPICLLVPSVCLSTALSLYLCFNRLLVSLRVSVLRSKDSEVLQALDLPKTTMLQFSPLNTILVTWQPYSSTSDVLS